MIKTLAFALALLLAGCASTQYKSYESVTTQVFAGQGGTKQVVDGMDVWDNGAPPRQYTVIGYVDDKRVDAPFQMLIQRSDIVKQAREAGGDAVIQVSNRSEVTGMVGFSTASAWGGWRRASAFGTSFATPTRENTSRFAVIKYVEAGSPLALPAPPLQAPAVQHTPVGALTAPVLVPLPVTAPATLPSSIGGQAERAKNGVTIAQPVDRSGPDRYAAEQYVRSTGCQTNLNVVFVSRVPGIETYSASCDNGAALVVQCQFGNCRALR